MAIPRAIISMLVAACTVWGVVSALLTIANYLNGDISSAVASAIITTGCFMIVVGCISASTPPVDSKHDEIIKKLDAIAKLVIDNKHR